MKLSKPTYHLLLLLTACLASCVEETLSDSKLADDQLQINVQYTPMEVATRAADVQQARKDTLWLNDSIYVDAIVSDFATQPDSVVTRGTPIQTAEEITSMNLYIFTDNNSNNGYSTSLAPSGQFDITANKGDYQFTTYPWPTTEQRKHTFFLISPNPTAATGAGMALNVAAGTRELTYTVPATIADQPDLCVNDYNKNLNIVNTPGSKNHRQVFKLKHCLTAIGFEAVGWDLKLNKVSIDHISNQATLNLESLTWGTPSGNETFVPILNGSWMNDTSKEQWKKAINPNGYLMMIPQDLGEKTLTFEYEERNEQSGLGPGKYEVKLKDIPGTAQWTAGKKIIYRLRLRVRPAVLDDVVTIYSHRPGYTSGIPLNIAADPDDDLTFTWDANWLKIHRGAPGYVNPTTGGAASGWKTGKNNWKNLYFFSTNEHLSILTPRTAIVTVVGKKSGIRTFKVQQKKEWDLKLNKEGEIYINSYRPGSMNNVNYYWIDGGAPVPITVTVSANGRGRSPNDKNWLTATTRSSAPNTYFNINYKWNIQAARPRTATITLTGTYGGITKKKSFTIRQRASSYWIMLHDDNRSFRFGLAQYDLGSHWCREEYRCKNSGQGERLFYQGEFGALRNYLAGYYWDNQANYVPGEYWSSTQASDGIFGSVRFRVYRLVRTYIPVVQPEPVWHLNDELDFRKFQKRYRCIITKESSLY